MRSNRSITYAIRDKNGALATGLCETKTRGGCENSIHALLVPAEDKRKEIRIASTDAEFYQRKRFRNEDRLILGINRSLDRANTGSNGTVYGSYYTYKDMETIKGYKSILEPLIRDVSRAVLRCYATGWGNEVMRYHDHSTFLESEVAKS